MKILLTQLATLLLFSFMSVVSQANILAEGIWQTSINDQGKTKRLVITIERDNNFKLVAFMDFPDDGWMAIPAKIAIDSNDISLNFFTIGARLEGVLKSGGKVLHAKFTGLDSVNNVKLKRIKIAPGVSPSVYGNRPVNEELAEYISSIDAVDKDKSAQLIKISNQLPFLNSVLVYQKGNLVSESYFNGLDENYVANIKSVNKSVLSMLVGIALEKKYLSSLDDKVIDLLPEYGHKEMDSRLKDITVRHLLSMRAGFKYNEMTLYAEGQNPIWDSQDSVKAILTLPLAYSPGERYSYATPQTHLLSAILARVTNMDLLDFANQSLFHPLNIKGVTWRKTSDGIYMGGSDMYMTPREMLQLGILYLNGGQFQGKQNVSKNRIEQSIKGAYPFSKISAKDTYGYLWKKWNLAGHRAYRAAGFGGQYIINIPSLSVTIITTANPRDLSGNDNNSDKILKTITSFVLQGLSKS